MKIQKLFSFIFLGLLFLASCSFTPSYEGNLYITRLPNKVAFNIGDNFSSEGLQVINTKNSQYITDYTLSIAEGTSLTEEGTFTVNITKDKFESANYRISVTALHQMNIIEYPTQSYKVGEYFSLTGLVLKDENNELISDFTSSLRVGDILSTSGDFLVTLTKEGYVSASFPITVSPLDAMKVNHLPNKTTYVQGETFDTTGLQIINDLTKQTITDYTLSISHGEELKNVGTITILVNKTGYPSVSFNITVTENTKPVTHPDKQLDIYYINDTHGSYIRDLSTGSSKYPEAGMAYIGQYMKEKKAAKPNNTLIISGGDMFQGGVESNLTSGAIMVDAMNEIGFDAMAIGNHEFDWKPETIALRASEMNFPLLSCNLFLSGSTVQPSFIKPYTVLNKDGIKVGIIGASQYNLGSSVLKSISDQFRFPNPGNYIKECSDELRTSYQCEVIIVVSHDGGTSSLTSLSSDYSDLVYTSETSGKKYADALLFAHDHNKKNFSVNNVPVVESACNGEYVANVTLNLKYNSSCYEVDSFTTSGLSSYASTYCTKANTYIDTLPQSAKYKDMIGDPDRVLYHFNQSYTESEFATLTCQILYWYVANYKSYFGDVTVYFADVNSGTIRVSVDSGDFTIRDLIKVCPFDNEIAIQKCTSNNVNRIKSFSNYFPSTPKYTGSYTYGASISYVVEKYSYLQTAYTYYGKTIYDAYLTYFDSVS